MTRTSLSTVLVVLVLGLLAAGAPAGSSQPPPFRILVTNDDGVRAPGILAVARALKEVGEVVIVAPATNQSATGHALSITDPVYADAVTLPGGLPATSLTATPATCVKVALDAPLVDRQPDLVVSGINRGYNLGMGAYVSGTVGAAREAALHGIPAIAASLASSADPHYETAAAMVVRIATTVRSLGLGRGVFLNVNVPPGAVETVRGVKVTAQSRETGVERFEEQRSPSGRRYFWSIYQEPRRDVEGTDVWAVANGYVAITPLRLGEFDAGTLEAWKGLRW